MPANAEALLKATKPKPLPHDKHQHYDEDSLADELEDETSFKVSTSLNANTSTGDSNNFKQRLDRILASPIMKPEKHITQVQVHEQNKPVPLPRKRVMFNQPEKQERHLDPSLTVTESDESQSFERTKI